MKFCVRQLRQAETRYATIKKKDARRVRTHYY